MDDIRLRSNITPGTGNVDIRRSRAGPSGISSTSISRRSNDLRNSLRNNAFPNLSSSRQPPSHRRPSKNLSDTRLVLDNLSNESREEGLLLAAQKLELLAKEQELKEQYFVQSNGWNTQLEIDIQRIGEKAEGWRWMHNEAARVFSFRFNLIGILNILLNAVATAGNFPWALQCQQNMDWIKVTAVILQLLVTISLAYAQFKNYGGRKANHKVAESGFAVLYYHVKTQLDFEPKIRQFGKDYAEWIQKEYTDLSANPDTPQIPGFIFKKYHQRLDRIFETQGVKLARVDELEQIVIHSDSNHALFNNIQNPYANKNINDIGPSVEDSNGASQNVTITIPKQVSRSVKPQGVTSLDDWHLRRFFEDQ